VERSSARTVQLDSEPTQSCRGSDGSFAPIPVAPEATIEPRGSSLLGHSASHSEWLFLPHSSHSPNPRSIGKKVATTVTEGPRSSRDTLSGNDEVLSCLCIYPSAVGADATRPELWASSCRQRAPRRQAKTLSTKRVRIS
jgi:hypothetical protein